MLVLDTNVLSELLKANPDGRVVSWIDSQPRQQLYTTAITRAEILFGIQLLPKSQRRQKLAEAAQAIFDDDLGGHVLPFDGTAADRYADIAYRRRNVGRPISQFDAIIASIAAVHSARLVTRNVLDFEECGVTIENPWGG